MQGPDRTVIEAERKQAEVENRKHTEVFQKIFDNAPIGINFFDADGRLLLVNREWERIFGWTLQQLNDQNRDIYVEAIPDPQLQQAARDFVAAATGVWGEFRIRQPDGQMVDVLGCVVALSDGTRVALSYDITERKHLEEELRQAHKMEAVGHLAGGVAHDFNNLLTVIYGSSDILLDTLPVADTARELVLEIRHAASRAASLTQQLLAFSRRTVVEAKVLDLNEAVRESEKMLRRLIGEDVQFSAVLDPALEPVKLDPAQLGQVIMNLAVNARDAMPTGGRLTIETRNLVLDATAAEKLPGAASGRYALLAVSDTGAGMPPEVKARLFEPFFTTKEPGKGTGLGLALVYGVVKQSRGFISVDSELKRGTSFKIYLPVVEGGRPVPKTPSSPQPAAGTETILLVEDEEAVRSVVLRVLRQAGYTVLEAGGGREAIQIALAHPTPIPLLITDVVMPEMGGRQLVEHLIKVRPGLRVLYLSGHTDDAVIRHGVLESNVAFLQKPFTIEALTNKVRQVLAAPG